MKFIKIGFVFLGCIVELFISGLIYGWASLLLVMRTENIYKNGEDRELTFSTIYNVSIALRQISELGHGIFNDYVGSKWTLLVDNILFSVGCILYSCYQYNEYTLYPAIICISVAGSGCHIGMLSMSKYLSKSKDSIIQTLFNCCHNAGSIILYIYFIIYKETSYPSSKFFTYYSFLSSGIAILCLWLPQTHCVKYNIKDIVKLYKNTHFLIILIYTLLFSYWTSAYYGTVANRVDDTLTEHFSLIIPCISIILSIPVGFILLKIHMLYKIIIVGILTILWSISVLLPNITAISYISFVLFGIMKAFFYPIITDYIIQYFGYTHIGVIYGITLTLTGPITFSYIPVISISLYNKSFWVSDLVQLLSFIIIFILSILRHTVYDKCCPPSTNNK